MIALAASFFPFPSARRDHDFSLSGVPILWETMVFGGPLDQEQRRYHTRQEALAGHEQMVEEVKKSMAGRKEDECPDRL